MDDRIKSALEALRPSVFPGPAAQTAFKNQLRLAETQWFPPERWRQYHLANLKKLAAFAARETEYGREQIPLERVRDATTLAGALSALPILSRETLRDRGDSLEPPHLPEGHGKKGELSSSGSTGMVVRLKSSARWIRWQRILGLRGHLWADRDFTLRMAVIRRQSSNKADYPDGRQGERWSSRADVPFPTGPVHVLNAYTSLDRQWEWLTRVKPDYLITAPSILRNFATRSDSRALGLKGVSTLGEIVDDELRALVREKLDLAIHDSYSSEEAGNMAIQCPDADGYHVQAEALILEVLDEQGATAKPGQIGRVVVTPLFNYASPLLRYELGDFAEAGGPCSCGRGLPMIRRIMGRRRNILTTTDGKQYWPFLRARGLQEIVKFREHQFRQVAPDVIEVWLAVEKPPTAEEEEKMRGIVAEVLPAPFRIGFHYVTEFPRNPNGKLEEFVSLVGAS